MKIFKTLLACLAIVSFASAYAVTEKEMEQARTTTARIYLRWSNNLAGYLDEANPATMAELESMLKEQDAKNLQAFKNAGVPSNYASWNKEDLIKYWTQTFFENAKGLTEQGSNQGARGRMKNELKKMSVGASENKETATTASPTGSEPVSAIDGNGQSGYDQRIQETKDAMSSNNDEAAFNQNLNADNNEGGSGTWVYILILVVLVIIVIILVLYASKTMRNSNSRKEEGYKPRGRRAEYHDDTHKKEESKQYPSAEVVPMNVRKAQETGHANHEHEIAQLREGFNRRLAAKQEEVDDLNRRVGDLQAEARELSATVDRLRKDNESLKAELESRKEEAAKAVRHEPVRETASKEEPKKTAEALRNSEIKEIYLGRVNGNGVFVRADRSFSPGNSVYKLVTTDGFSGTYRVVDNRTLEMLALEHPEEFLGGGCVAKDINDTIGRTSIITESAGTAIFEGGAWRVIRKAHIRYD